MKVVGLMSTKTMRAPMTAKAFAEDTKVNDGTITWSPASKSSSNAESSRAAVQDVVRSTDAPSWISLSCFEARAVKGPSPERRAEENASATNSNWFGATVARLKGIMS